MKRVLIALGFGAAILCTHAPALAAPPGWPDKTIRILVGFAPGGTQDITARALAEPMSKALGVPVVVENRPGAQGMLAMTALARAEPDGYTIGLSSNQAIAQLPPMLPPDRLTYDPLKDFTPIGIPVTQYGVLMVNSNVPVKDVSSFVQWAKAGGTRPFGTTSVGSNGHLTGEMLARAAGLPMEHIPYRVRANLVTDFIGGQIPIMIDPLPSSLPLIQQGRVKAIAVGSPKRSSVLPDLPTLAESGYPEIALETWLGVFGPAGLPSTIVERLNKEVAAALSNPAVKQRMIDLSFEIVAGTPQGTSEALREQMKKDVVFFDKLVKQFNIRVD